MLPVRLIFLDRGGTIDARGGGDIGESVVARITEARCKSLSGLLGPEVKNIPLKMRTVLRENTVK